MRRQDFDDSVYEAEAERILQQLEAKSKAASNGSEKKESCGNCVPMNGSVCEKCCLR